MSIVDLTPLRSAIAGFAPQGRAGLLPALHAAQSLYGYISEQVATEIGRMLGVPLADVFGVIDFYAMLYREPMGRRIVRVCADPACAMRGADAVLDAVCRKAKVVLKGNTSADGEYTVERAPCLGMCNEGVAIHVTRLGSRDVSFAHVQDDDLEEIFAGRGRGPDDFVGGDVRILTALCGRGSAVGAATLAEYEASGGMQAVRKVLGGDASSGDGSHGWSAQRLIDEVKQSGLVGRGGAAFPTGVKWEGAAHAPGSPKYVVVNADESELGTFKDRVLMEGDPNRILEGAILAAYAIGANKAYFYIRGEYPTAIEQVEAAIEECRAAGFLGKSILGSGFDLDIETRRGAGAYICGEETALFESVEGKRGFPRIKPPFPTTHGLFGQPTAINNVETLAAIPYIVTRGVAAFRQIGTEKSTGPKLFCVSGDVTRPGLYEVPFGVTIRHLVEDLAGGVTGDLQAILFGGAAGGFATEKDLDVKLSFEDLRSAGLPLGSGVVTVFNETRDMRDVLVRLARFFAHESCGKCYPCQLGTQRQFEILERVAAGQPQDGDWDRLSDVGWTMTDASLCGLGQTAAWAVQSAMKLWPGLFT